MQEIFLYFYSKQKGIIRKLNINTIQILQVFMSINKKKGNKQPAKSNEQAAKSSKQKAKSNEQRARINKQQATSKNLRVTGY